MSGAGRGGAGELNYFDFLFSILENIIAETCGKNDDFVRLEIFL